MSMNIRNICVYDDPAELMTDYGYDLTDEQEHYFSHICDFEPIRFVVVDDETVYTCDSLNGDVQTVQSVADFYKYNMEWYEDEEG